MSSTPHQSDSMPVARPPTPRLSRGNLPTTGLHLGWVYGEERLSDSTCDEIVAACREFPILPPNTVGEDHYPSHRLADVRKVGVTLRTQWLFDLLCDVAEEVSRSANHLELAAITRSPQYVEYRPDWGHFDWHNDYSHDLPQVPRKLTVIIQLSHPTEYEGGRLEVFGTKIDELPRERGTILAFPSLIFHRVTPVTSGLRRALVAWIAGPRIQ